MSDEMSPNIEFLSFHRPPLLDGNYLLEAQQQVTVSGSPRVVETFRIERSFTITGERFQLTPQEILSVYPPPGSAGDHENVLPHVVLGRSTLPWERKAQSNQEDREAWPWLAVLLFDQDEAPKPQVIDLKTLYGDRQSVTFPDLAREPTEHDDDRVTVIDVPPELLQRLAPTGPELALLAHVRQPQTAAGTDEGGERALVMGNRLPRRGRDSVAHLVSVEDHYRDGRLFAPPGKPVRLVSLKSWRFRCLDEESYMITERVLRATGEQQLPETIAAALRPLLHQEIVGTDAFTAQLTRALSGGASLSDSLREQLLHDARYKRLTFKGVLLGLDRDLLRLPRSAIQPGRVPRAAELERAFSILEQGSVPLSHHLRTGKKMLSWYHGPLAPNQGVPDTKTLPVPAADALLRRNPHTGIYDVSYAAAWELGRLLALQDTPFALALFHWKRAVVRRAKAARTRLEHLPFGSDPTDVPLLPDGVRQWLQRLARLERVPFNYLVPDLRMLPRESIRFFIADQVWADCLIDGAVSVGRAGAPDGPAELALYGTELSLQSLILNGEPGRPVPTLSGFLLRSDLVPGWPHLQVDGYVRLHATLDVEPPSERLPLLRMERLADDILLCLFAGIAQTVDIHQKPEGLHAGVSQADPLHHTSAYYKRRRDPQTGEEIMTTAETPDGSARPVTVTVPFRPEAGTGQPADPPPHRVLDVATLARDLHDPSQQTATAADFALQMVEGVARVRFTVPGPKA